MINAEKGPFRVSVVGIDGAGKDTVAEQVLARLSRDNGLTTALVGRPSYMFEGGQPQEVCHKFTAGMDSFRDGAEHVGGTRAKVAATLVNVVAQSRVLEPMIVRQNPELNVVASARDTIVYPVVYSAHYIPQVHRMSLEDKLKHTRTVTNGRRDLIIRLGVDPEVALQRVLGRIAKENEAGGGSYETSRKEVSRPSAHENITDLAVLSAEYDRVMDTLGSSSWGPQIAQIDTTEIGLDEVVGSAYDIICNSMGVRDTNGLN